MSSSFVCGSRRRWSRLAERLYKEVIAEYSDVVHRTLMHRELEAVCRLASRIGTGSR